ncbi:transcription regulator hth laci [Trichococcus palustris]|uniref:Transcription regulator hth laci n=1 Tax=Trichococcus palustris TaxID=140314 RepID=A0A143YSA0_9LACT|nr:LacI family DNA-binding transcriptional regulator [Trichococcus palustris]CZQ96224.1 transcription regulator hth laci [Trichococcus palustris]SFK72874.1 transcriptional regulator, LacI family [Trichococcus palustris]
MVTINDIAKQAGVAKSTVSRYLNGGAVSEKTKAKLDAIVARNDYTPNKFAQSLKAKRTHMVGAIIPRLNSYATNEALKGLENSLRLSKNQLLITNADQNREREIEAIYTLAKQKVDGIVLFAAEITPEHEKAFEESATPVVIVGQSHPNYHCVIHDDEKAGYSVGAYAVANGHRNILVFGVDEADQAVGITRRKGIEKAFVGKDITYTFVKTSFSMMDAYKLALEVLPETKATFIIGATDNIAIGIMRAAHELQMDIPNRLSLAGFGGYEITEAVHPRITTVHFPFHEAGILAADILLQLIEGKEMPYVEKLDNHLMIRESTQAIK